MEQPYKGRAIINDNFIDLQIIIPVKENWFIILLLGAWLCGWLIGETAALEEVSGVLGGNSVSFFIVFWLIAWTVGGFFAFRGFLWNLIGKEIITVGQNRLTIDKKGALFYKPKTYDLNEVKHVRIQDDNIGKGFFSGRNDSGTFNSGGTIRFDYGLQTVKFAGGIDEAEAKFIVDKLKEKHLLTEKNYS